jgi:hypothetical protein
MEYITKEDAKVKRERKQVVIDRELDKLYEKHGTISTDLVIHAASNKKHPLHQYFEWDDSVAARKYRETQALQMIMASKMVVVLEQQAAGPPRIVGTGEATEVRKLVNAFRGEGFKMRNEALQEDTTRAAIVAKKVGVLRSWCTSVVDIKELSALRELIMDNLP